MLKVDVIINVYGKPWQTLCTLKSLMKHSGEHINTIYFIEEVNQPYNDNVKFVMNEFNNVIHYTPQRYVFTKFTNGTNMSNYKERFEFRYQYGIEMSKNKYVFITHNDILYSSDIIGNMLNEIEDNAGIGLIGQCWNCPAFKARVCNGDTFQDYKPTFDEVIELTKTHVPARHTQHNQLVNKIKPMPLPECRLNEFACIINREITIKECYPLGNTPLFGSYDILDLGDAWFRSLVLKGYGFKNYDINKDSIHGFYSRIEQDLREYNDNSNFYVSGYPTQLDFQKYVNSEAFAKKYYIENLK